jgi:cytosine deaminase
MNVVLTDEQQVFMDAAIEEAIKGRDEGGIPIGSVVVIDNQVVGRGHNRRVQRHSAILHAEMDAIENAGRLTSKEYARATLYSTLSPCDMCSGMALLYKIRRIVIGENKTFQGPEQYVRQRGVEITLVNDPRCVELMREFIERQPTLWNEDIGV